MNIAITVCLVFISILCGFLIGRRGFSDDYLEEIDKRFDCIYKDLKNNQKF